MRIETKGIVENIGKSKTLSNGTEMCQVLIKVPGFHNSFGEKVGPDLQLPIGVFGDKIDMVFNLKHGQKVEVAFYLNSKEVVTDREVFHSLRASLATIKPIA
jgi:primosomal replication protein N